MQSLETIWKMFFKKTNNEIWKKKKSETELIDFGFYPRWKLFSDIVVVVVVRNV